MDEVTPRLKLAPALLALLLSFLFAAPAAAFQSPAPAQALAPGDPAAACVLLPGELTAFAADPAADPDPDDAAAPTAGSPPAARRPVAAAPSRAGTPALARRPFPYRARAPPSA